jgi:hypothetical protein
MGSHWQEGSVIDNSVLVYYINAYTMYSLSASFVFFSRTIIPA